MQSESKGSREEVLDMGEKNDEKEKTIYMRWLNPTSRENYTQIYR